VICDTSGRACHPGADNPGLGNAARVRPDECLSECCDVGGIWGVTPRRSVEAECSRRGLSAVVSGCIDILDGKDPDEELLIALAGPAARSVIMGLSGGTRGYWPRVMAMRGLLYAWEDRATTAVIRGTKDEAWRVREMALKVIARQRLGDAIQAVVDLQADRVRRVRAASERALQALVIAQA
jgi:hypothetical protein